MVFAVITFCALGLPAHSRGGGTRNTRARSCCCWCWWCLLIMLFPLSLTQVAIAAQLSHQIILTSARVFRSGLTDRLPGTIIVELKWHWKGAFGVKGEFNSFQLSKPTTFCKCLISIMTPRCLHCEALLLLCLLIPFFIFAHLSDRGALLSLGFVSTQD